MVLSIHLCPTDLRPTVMCLHFSTFHVFIVVTVSRNEGSKRLMIMDAAVHCWLGLVSAVK